MNTPVAATAVLAGGRATRLGPLAARTPKAMLRVGGSPFIAWQVSGLLRAGLRPVVVLAGHLGDQLAAYFARPPWPELGVQVWQTAQAGTGADLVTASRRLAAPLVLACNGDTLLDLPIRRLLATHARSGLVATIALTHRMGVPNQGAYLISADGRVLHCAEGGDPLSDPPPPDAWRGSSAGMVVVDRAAIAGLDPARFGSLWRDLLPYLVRRGLVAAFDNGVRAFLDFGTPDRLAELHRHAGALEAIYGPLPNPAEPDRPGRAGRLPSPPSQAP